MRRFHKDYKHNGSIRRIALRASITATVIVLLAISLLRAPQHAAAINSPTPQWSPVSQILTADNITFTDAIHGWAVAYRGLYFTNDGGLSWSLNPLPSTGDTYLHVVVVTPQHLYVYGENTIIESTDGGATWSAPTHPPVGYNDLVQVAAPAPNTLWAISQKSGVFKSTDNGATWQTITPGNAQPGTQWLQLLFVSPTEAWLVGLGQYPYPDFTLRTTDGGATWTSVGPWFTSCGGYCNGSGQQYAFNGLSGISAGPDGQIAYTGDGGTTWSYTTLPIPISTTNMIFDVAAGPSGQFLVSTLTDLYASYDGGHTWSNETLPIGSNDVSSVGFSSDQPFAIVDGYFMRHTSVAVTATPTAPPSPTATQTTIPTWTPLPTDTPIPTWTPRPTDTPTPTWTPWPTDTATPTDISAPADTPQPLNTPTATAISHPSNSVEPSKTPVGSVAASLGTSTRHLTHQRALRLLFHLSPSRVASGSILIIRIQTERHAHVSADLRVTRRDVIIKKIGKKRQRTIRVKTLYDLTQAATTKGDGQVVLRLRVRYRPSHFVPATLTVSIRLATRIASREQTVIIVPAPVLHKPHRH